MGSSYRYLGQYIKAEDCLKKALRIFRSVHSPSKLRVINGVTELHLLVISSETTTTISISTSTNWRNTKILYKYLKLGTEKGSKCFYSCAAVVSVCMGSCMYASQVKTRLYFALSFIVTWSLSSTFSDTDSMVVHRHHRAFGRLNALFSENI